MPVNSRALKAIANQPSAFDNLLDAPPRKPTDVPGFALPESYGMGGVPESVQVNQITPREFLDSLTEDPAQSQRVIDRIVERNQGVAKAVEDPELFKQSLDNPYTEMTGEWSPDSSAGIWDANRRVVAYPPSGNAAVDEGYWPGDIDIRQHENVHALLQPEPPDEMRFVDSLMARNDTLSDEFQPNLFDRLPEGMLDEQNFPEFATNKRELMNLLFSVKRMSEKLYGEDFGSSLAKSNELGKRIMRSEPDIDPEFGYIDPDMLNGYERQVDYLRELYRASNEYGRAYIRDMMHKLGMVGAVTAVTAGSEDPLGGLTSE